MKQTKQDIIKGLFPVTQTITRSCSMFDISVVLFFFSVFRMLTFNRITYINKNTFSGLSGLTTL